MPSFQVLVGNIGFGLSFTQNHTLAASDYKLRLVVAAVVWHRTENSSGQKFFPFGSKTIATSKWNRLSLRPQQLREAFPEDAVPRYLILDRDTKYEGEATEVLESLSGELIRTAYESPWQNGIAERWVELPSGNAGSRDRVQ